MSAPARKLQFSPTMVVPTVLCGLVLVGGLCALGPWRSVTNSARRPATVMFDARLSPVHEKLPAGPAGLDHLPGALLVYGPAGDHGRKAG
jgi:hypothetical protein